MPRTNTSSGFSPAKRLDPIDVSPILQIMALARELKDAGRDVIDLSVGEPDFNTPDHVIEAADRAMRAGKTKYTALDGTPELKAAIREKFRRDNDIDYADDEILVSAGAKQTLFNAMMATLEVGDEVILPAPYWASYVDMIKVVGGNPVIVPCSEKNNFLLSPEELEEAISERTRWIVFNSPSNPSGAAYARDDYMPLLNVLERHPQIFILADDIYEHIVYNGFEFATPASIASEFRERTLTVNGVSKAYAMTGWRIGYGGGPKALIKSMKVVQSQATSCPCSISQAAAVAALRGPQTVIADRRTMFENRRNFVVAALNEIDGISTNTPNGAFYVFANCEGAIGRKTPKGVELESDIDFCDYLLRECNIAVVPGSEFGLSPYFRASYAASDEVLKVACDRISRACASLT